MSAWKKTTGWMAAMALMLAPDAARACATCFGAPDAAMTKGLNMGILSLLLVVMFVLGMMAAFAIYLMRKAASMPPVEEDSPVSAEAAEKVH